MSNQNYDPSGTGSGNAAYGNSQSAEEPGSTSIYPDLGGDPTGTSGTVDDDVALYSEEGVNDVGTAGIGSDYAGTTGAYGAGVSSGTYGASSGSGGGDAKDKAKEVAGHAKDRAADVKDTAVAKASEVKDVALERGGDVAAVAKDELSRLTGEARDQVQTLWSQASTQLRDQVDTGRHQLADLLHSLADELGEMASKSSQSGPVTSLAKQAAHRGGELSHWLANAEPNDLLNDIRRFARRRPVVFLGGAALAGVLVGRLGRGLMAAAQDNNDTTSSAAIGNRAYGGYGSYGSVPATGGVTTTPAVSLEEVPEFGTSNVPTQPAGYPTETSSIQPLPGQSTGGDWR